MKQLPETLAVGKTILIPKSEYTALCKAGIKGKRKKKKEVESHRFQAIKLVFPGKMPGFLKTTETNEENPMEAPLPSHQGAGAAGRLLPNLKFALLSPNLWENPIKKRGSASLLELGWIKRSAPTPNLSMGEVRVLG